MLSLYGESTKRLKLTTRGRQEMAWLQEEKKEGDWRYEYWREGREHHLPILLAISRGEDKILGRAGSFPLDVDHAEDLQGWGYIIYPGAWYGTDDPWFIGGRGNDNIVDAKGKVICGISSNVKRPHIEKEYDLALIAAAPVMRKALIEVDKYLNCDDLSQGPFELREIVKKALALVQNLEVR